MDETRDLVALITCFKLLTADLAVLLLMLHAEWEATSKLTSGDAVLRARQEQVKRRLIKKQNLIFDFKCSVFIFLSF